MATCELMLVAGVDISTKGIDIAVIPIDTDAGLEPVTLRSRPLPASKDAAQRPIAAALITAELLADVDDHPVSTVWVEEPYGHFRIADRALLPIYGAVLAAAGAPSRRVATGISTPVWRQAIGLSNRLTKPEAITEARRYIQASTHPELARSHALTEHTAEALLVALAGRALTWAHTPTR